MNQSNKWVRNINDYNLAYRLPNLINDTLSKTYRSTKSKEIKNIMNQSDKWVRNKNGYNLTYRPPNLINDTLSKAYRYTESKEIKDIVYELK